MEFLKGMKFLYYQNYQKKDINIILLLNTSELYKNQIIILIM